MCSSLSVIIPTTGRPQYLPRAVQSALLSALNDNVEVIVVPNGSDTSWEEVAKSFDGNNLIRWEPISTKHANAARNHGLALATGEFVRFLDDDDYLYPEECKLQLQELIVSNADLASGNVSVVDDSGARIKTYLQPRVNDFVEGILSPFRCPQPGAHLYRRKVLDGLFWDESCSVGQDTAWMIQLAASRELIWLRGDKTVAAWVQHRGVRVTRGKDPGNTALKYLAVSLQWAVNELAAQDRLTELRLKAASEGLWTIVQKGLRYDFNYWKRVAAVADSYYQGCRPPSRIHKIPLIRSLPPLLIESGLIPVRNMYSPIRKLLLRMGFNDA